MRKFTKSWGSDLVDKGEGRCHGYDRIHSLKAPKISAMFLNYLSLQHGGLQYEEKLAVGGDGRFAGCD
jgi:hypothetical protein